MNNSLHLSHLLKQWYPLRDQNDWVLASIYDTDGPCYRKPGAMMLFSSQGQQLGMLSGGCLESDIGINARKVMQTGQPQFLCYDGSDEDDMSFHLGIGCGGTLYIMLQPIHAANNYLMLIDVYKALNQRVSGYYYQPIINQKNAAQGYFTEQVVTDIAASATLIHSAAKEKSPCHNPVQSLDQRIDKPIKTAGEYWLATPIIPEPHILVVGGGIDARPLVAIAKQLGWKVSLWDPRPANARKEYFPQVDHLIQGDASVLTTFAADKDVNAAILMSHNVTIDAHALHALAESPLHYMALLGPTHRKQQVMEQANINQTKMPFVFAGPAGLDIGGTLPESIALSILAECHGCLFDRNSKSMSLTCA